MVSALDSTTPEDFQSNRKCGLSTLGDSASCDYLADHVVSQIGVARLGGQAGLPQASRANGQTSGFPPAPAEKGWACRQVQRLTTVSE